MEQFGMTILTRRELEKSWDLIWFEYSSSLWSSVCIQHQVEKRLPKRLASFPCKARERRRCTLKEVRRRAVCGQDTCLPDEPIRWPKQIEHRARQHPQPPFVS